MRLINIQLRLTSKLLKRFHSSGHIPFEKRVPQECIRLSNVPLLSSIVKSYSKMKPMKNYTILNIQHELGDISAQVEALIVLGALPNDLYFLPPAYSHNKQFELFISKHFQVPKENFFESSSYRLRYNYDKYRLLNVIFHLNKMVQMELLKERNKENNLLVLDDGGCFSESLSILFDIDEDKLNLDELIQNVLLSLKISKSDIKLILSYFKSIEIRLVEQTSRGLFKYQDQINISSALRKLGISMIDVASSQPKKILEPSLIAEASLNMLSYLFYDATKNLKIPKPSKFDKCLLLGYGSIGQAIAYALTHKGDLGMFAKDSVKISDIDLDKQKLAENDGFQLFDQWNSKDQFNYVIGCAGRCSFPISCLSLVRNNSYLISVSSAAIEFPFNEMIQYALLNNDIKINVSNTEINRLDDKNIHQNITFIIENNKSLTVVNGGMPITFLGVLNPAIPEKFDITISLMIAASIQATFTKQENNQQNRIIPLDSNYSKFIFDWFSNNKHNA
ncbi:unnamed protein product [Adineta steineri]|uniref:S-adenosyl-L-homocysteine hydrolase NAD binding domain-containing protein n=1 Tax=Adineta steineri TaxID=433720 RepID=A0A819U9J3_9BILA|nr:unnamed protein product [Adineta steineri]